MSKGYGIGYKAGLAYKKSHNSIKSIFVKFGLPARLGTVLFIFLQLLPILFFHKEIIMGIMIVFGVICWFRWFFIREVFLADLLSEKRISKNE
ncbi:hypothetical protein QJU87_04180 [Pasteurella skyensis]|uniref:hypothetical protein n=1 Tax=Phocoenobacter skyensis TaxID=97481 RepID=UPI00275A5325|nr:hypothetical protein [Pasteurella skyensis]MDP8189062.1 hypothetical protein [Pasteurella skyensis]